MERIRADDSAALRTLIERYWANLVAYARTLLGDSDEAEDVAQDAFVRVWRHRTVWIASGSVSGYLYRITRNLAFNRDRDNRARRRRSAGEAMSALRIQRPPTPDDELATTMAFGEVEAAIDHLPPRRREIFVLSRFHSLTYSEIAQTMGISEQTVANQMSSALADLRTALSKLISPR
jgi:RNA polymerase sigma-70 factor (ECF subfamily)